MSPPSEWPDPPTDRDDVIAWFPTLDPQGNFLEWKPVTYQDAHEAHMRQVRWVCTTGTTEDS